MHGGSSNNVAVVSWSAGGLLHWLRDVSPCAQLAQGHQIAGPKVARPVASSETPAVKSSLLLILQYFLDQSPRTFSWQSQLALNWEYQLCGALVTTTAPRSPLAIVVIFSLAHSYSKLDSGPASRVKQSCQLCCRHLQDICN